MEKEDRVAVAWTKRLSRVRVSDEQTFLSSLSGNQSSNAALRTNGKQWGKRSRPEYLYPEMDALTSEPDDGQKPWRANAISSEKGESGGVTPKVVFGHRAELWNWKLKCGGC